MSIASTQLSTISCLKLNYDDFDANLDDGSPCKTTKYPRRAMPSFELAPPLPLFKENAVYTSPLKSRTQSTQSLLSVFSDTTELDSDVSIEDDMDFDDLQASPIRGGGGLRSFSQHQIYHRANKSVLGIMDIQRKPTSRFPEDLIDRCPSPRSPLASTTRTPCTTSTPNHFFEGAPLFRREYLEVSNDENLSETGKARLSSTCQSQWMPSAKVRRTQSMFATPEQMLHEQVGEIYHPPQCDTSVSQCMSYLGSPECLIPTFNVRQDPFPRMTQETLCNLIDGSYGKLYDDIIVVDCRFEYEYEGGHIQGAINVNTKQQLEQVLLSPSKTKDHHNTSRLLVFHCEYSAFRSPMMASHLRRCDRELNAKQYPHLYYPDVVVLEGGYSQFYASASHRCVPQNYVGMNTQEHENTCKREMQKFRNGMKNNKRLGMIMGNNMSTPQLANFKFPAPALAFRSQSVANLPEDI